MYTNQNYAIMTCTCYDQDLVYLQQEVKVISLYSYILANVNYGKHIYLSEKCQWLYSFRSKDQLQTKLKLLTLEFVVKMIFVTQFTETLVLSLLSLTEITCSRCCLAYLRSRSKEEEKTVRQKVDYFIDLPSLQFT